MISKKTKKILFALIFTTPLLMTVSCRHDDPAPLENRFKSLPPPATTTTERSNDKDVAFIAFGDFGDESDGQMDVARAMKKYCAENKCDFVVTLGDNFQDAGVESVNDPLWKSTYRDVYSDVGLPFYASLGNHDVKGSISAQIEYSKVDSSWHMDGEYYSLKRPPASETPTVEFFIINTGNNSYDRDERSWLKKIISESKARWKILISHKPIISNGDVHGDNEIEDGDDLISDICKKVDLVLSGHDHIFSHLKGKSREFHVGCEVEQLVIGTGGGYQYGFDSDDARAIKSGAFSGFGWFEAKQTSLLFKMIDKNGKLFYTKEWINE